MERQAVDACNICGAAHQCKARLEENRLPCHSTADADSYLHTAQGWGTANAVVLLNLI